MLYAKPKISRKDADGKLNLYLKLFLLFGIDICYKKENRTIKCFVSTMRCIMKFYWFVIFVMLLSRLYTMLIDGKEYKSVLAKIFFNTCSFLIWNHVFRFQKVIKRRIMHLQNLLNVLQISPSKKFISVIWILSTMITVTTIAVYTCRYNENHSVDVIRMYTFGLTNYVHENMHLSLVLWHIQYFILSYGYFFPCYFALSYIILCHSMAIVLCKHVEMCQNILIHRFITPVDCNICFMRYDLILATFKKLNSNLACPAFLETAYNLCGMFFIAFILLKCQTVNLPMSILLFVTNFILLTGMTFAASSVNLFDKSAKDINLEILRSLSRKDRNQLKESAEILSDACHAPSFALSGWHFFEYSRGFYLTAIGCLMTYSLLIIQI